VEQTTPKGAVSTRLEEAKKPPKDVRVKENLRGPTLRNHVPHPVQWAAR